MTECFSRQGATVYAADLALASVEETAAMTGARPVKLDVTQSASWDDVAEQIGDAEGGLDALVNCAGVDGTKDNIAECSDEEWQRVMAVNLDGTFLGMKTAVPLMRARGSGAIVNLSSVLAVVADGEALSYTTSKGAVRGLTKSVALELAPHGIRCNSIHPGYIRTPMTERWLDDLGAKGQGQNELESLHPIGRLGDPNEVANVALYLISDEASFVTGAEFAVDGGYLAV